MTFQVSSWESSNNVENIDGSNIVNIQGGAEKREYLIYLEKN